MPRPLLLGLLPALLVVTGCSPEHPNSSALTRMPPKASAVAPSASGGVYVPWEEIVDDATGIRFLSSNRMGFPEYRKPRIERRGTRIVRFYDGGDLRFPDRLGMNVAIVPDDPRSAREVAEQGRSLAANAFSSDWQLSSSGPVVHRPTVHEDAYDYEATIDFDDGESLPVLFTVVKCRTGTALLETMAYGETPNRRQLEEFHDAFRDGVRCPV